MKSLLLAFLLSLPLLGIGQITTDWDIPRFDNETEIDVLSSTTHQLIDMDGDGYLDLVDSENHNTGDAWTDGTNSFWKVHLGHDGGFAATAEEWLLPVFGLPSDLDQLTGIYHSLMDMNGDGKPDLVDTQNHNNGEVWKNGTQAFWKVYINFGSGFTQQAEEWDIPVFDFDHLMNRPVSGYHMLRDMNGDGYPDFIDAQNHNSNLVWLNGTQQYWKVYYNDGSKISSTASLWDIPPVNDDYFASFVSYSTHQLIDMNGDGIPDMVDSENHNSGSVWKNGTVAFWKVYFNSGSSFNMANAEFDIPQFDIENKLKDIYSVSNSLADVDGDGFPDLVDSENHNTGDVWKDGTRQFWRVYLNTGSDFHTQSEEWDVYNIDDDNAAGEVSNTHHALLDMNGDGFVDLVDAENHNSQEVWKNLNDPYWKVYYNNGSEFGGQLAASVKSSVHAVSILSPNPGNGKIQISNAANWHEIEILDLQGRLLEQSGPENQIDLSHYEAGMYIIRLKNNAVSETHRYIVLK